MAKEFVERMHRQVQDLVRAHVSGLEQDISRLQREVNQAFTSLLERTDSAATVSDDDELLSKLMAAVDGEVGRAGEDSARLGSDLALLRDGVDYLGRQTTQAEVLNALVERASSFAPRLILFVVKGESALGWAAGGTESPLDKSAVRGIAIPLGSDTILRAALQAQQTFYGSATDQADNALVVGKLGSISPQRVLCVPLRVRGKSAAVLYADSSDRDVQSINVEAIELLVSTTGFVVELTSLRARVGEPAPRAQQQPQPEAAKPARTGGLGTGDLSTSSGSLDSSPRVQPAAEPKQPAPSFFKPAAEPHAPAPAYEPAVAAPAAYQPASKPQEVVPAKAPEAARVAPARGVGGDHDEDQHNNARRFARLLVSEIKLYNEQKVVEGRNNNDLYDRLKEDIDRSRQMYEKRIPSSVTTRFDYFYDELVNTLAEGNPAKLGSDYPGPSLGA
ncbi:MAG TPA: hypothetical protein VI756_17110 [Blastocatellia bacterium]